MAVLHPVVNRRTGLFGLCVLYIVFYIELLFGGIHTDCFRGGLSIVKGNIVFLLLLLPASFIEKNEIFLSVLLNLSKSICNCLQSKVFGVGTNEGPLEHKEIRPSDNSQLLFVRFMGS